jgi:hypothetical protein
MLRGHVTDYERGLQQEAQAAHEYPRCYEQAVRDLRQVKSELDDWNGKGKFKPADAHDAEENLGKLIGWASTMANISPRVDKADVDTYRKAVVKLQGSSWTANVMTNLATALQGLPPKP